ncbi:hypothetical protein GQ457_12G015990 [Hibiscus cannabinus]
MAIEENVVELSGEPSMQSPVTGVNSDQPFSNKHVNIRLDDFNFLLWKQQVMLIIRGHDLEQYLDESTVVPPKVMTKSDGQLVLNPAYRRFKKEDCNLSSWLLSTMNPNILPQLVGADSTAAIWNTILKLYSKLSTTKIMNIHCRLRALKKGSLTIKEYTTQVKEICDLLATSGSPVSDIEQIATVLNGLPVEFEPFVAAITVSREPYTFESVTSILMDVEPRILDPMRMPMSINVTRYSADNNSESIETGQPASRSYSDKNSSGTRSNEQSTSREFQSSCFPVLDGSQVHMSATNASTATEESLSAQMSDENSSAAAANSPVADVSEEGVQAQVPISNSPTTTYFEEGLSAQMTGANSPAAVVSKNPSTATVPVSEAADNTGDPIRSKTDMNLPLQFDSIENIAYEHSPHSSHYESDDVSLPASGEGELARLTGFTALEGYFDDVGSIFGKHGKPIWEVRTWNWKLREGENRLSRLLEGISIASLGKARRQEGSSITFVQVRVSVPFNTGIGTTPLGTDTGSLGQFLGVLGSMISYVLVPELAVYDFMSFNDSFDSKFHTRACKTTNYVLVTLKRTCRP